MNKRRYGWISGYLLGITLIIAILTVPLITWVTKDIKVVAGGDGNGNDFIMDTINIKDVEIEYKNKKSTYFLYTDDTRNPVIEVPSGIVTLVNIDAGGDNKGNTHNDTNTKPYTEITRKLSKKSNIYKIKLLSEVKLYLPEDYEIKVTRVEEQPSSSNSSATDILTLAIIGNTMRDMQNK